MDRWIIRNSLQYFAEMMEEELLLLNLREAINSHLNLAKLNKSLEYKLQMEQLW
jgi:hypothetical protein